MTKICVTLENEGQTFSKGIVIETDASPDTIQKEVKSLLSAVESTIYQVILKGEL